MFRVNDYVVYGMTGVCKVVDIKEEKFANNTKKNYYVLSPVYTKNTIIKSPVDNQKVAIRKIHSKEEVCSLIDSMNTKETLLIEDDRNRSEKFKSLLRSGDCKDLITVIKIINSSKKDKGLKDKKINKSDDEIMKTAEKLLNEEFAVILDISPEEVTPYILNYMKQ